MSHLNLSMIYEIYRSWLILNMSLNMKMLFIESTYVADILR